MAILLGSVTEARSMSQRVSEALESGRFSGQSGLRGRPSGKRPVAIDPKPARLTERPHAAKTRRLLPAASYDTIQVLGFMIYGCLCHVENMLGRGDRISGCSTNAPP